MIIYIIPQGDIHRLENIGQNHLTLIEIQIEKKYQKMILSA